MFSLLLQLATDNNALKYLLGPSRYCCTRYKALIRLVFYVQKQLGFKGSKPSNMPIKTARDLIYEYRAPRAWLDQVRPQMALKMGQDNGGASNNTAGMKILEDSLVARWFAESLSKQFPPAMKYIALNRPVPADHGAGKKNSSGRVGKIQNRCGLLDFEKAKAEAIIGQHILDFFNGVPEKRDADDEASRERKKKQSKKRKREAAAAASSSQSPSAADARDYGQSGRKTRPKPDL